MRGAGVDGVEHLDIKSMSTHGVNYKRNMNYMMCKSCTGKFMRRVDEKSIMEHRAGSGYTTFVYNSQNHLYRTFIFEVDINHMEMKI